MVDMSFVNTMLCHKCDKELELVSVKDVDPTATNSDPAMTLIIADKRRYITYECPECGLLYWIRNKAGEI